MRINGGGNRTIANYYNYLVNKYGKLSGMAYCAGIVDILPIQSIDYNHIDNIFTINHHIPLLFIQTFIDTINSSDISIVIVSSVVGVNPASGMMAYSASKAAITQSCKSIANNCKIRINTISPSDINTPMTMNELVKPLVEQRLDSYPFGIGEPNDVANMTIFLLSNKAKYLSGQNYIIDSGGVV
ncbi:MAG: SDR family oxidoreductase [Helicobacteraceae bacterium]|nr:SDR family oxidoreductase [Helicobacteraceae bacterium]